MLQRNSMHPFQKRCFNPLLPPRYHPKTMTAWHCVTLQLHARQGSQQKTKGAFPNSSAPPCSQEVGTEILEKEHMQTVAKTGTRCLVYNTAIWRERETAAKHSRGLFFPFWIFLPPRKLLISSAQAYSSLWRERRTSCASWPGGIRRKFRVERTSPALELASDTLHGVPLLVPTFVQVPSHWTPDPFWGITQQHNSTAGIMATLRVPAVHQHPEALNSAQLQWSPVLRSSSASPTILKAVHCWPTSVKEERREAAVRGKKILLRNKQLGRDPAALVREAWTRERSRQRHQGSNCKQGREIEEKWDRGGKKT